MSTYKTPGQIAYEADCRVEPNYHTGTPRAPWDKLTDFARDSWERNPTRRAIANEREQNMRSDDALSAHPSGGEYGSPGRGASQGHL